MIQAYSSLAEGEKFQDPTIVQCAEKYGKSPAQILIRYSLQKGWIPLAKSSTKERMQDNRDVFGFEISDDDMKVLDEKDGLLENDW